MDEYSRSLLSNLVKKTSTASEDVDSTRFLNALEQINCQSVFDILRLSKRSFVREMRRLTGVNANLAYENAQCYATQIARLYRNELVSSKRYVHPSSGNGIRSLVEIGPSFQNLFQENWSTFCNVGAVEAVDSPAAYLTSLYRFATEKLESSTADAKRVVLDTRRPDLKNLTIDQVSTFKAVPMLEIVNKVLEEGIRRYTDSDGNTDAGKTIYELIAQKKHPFLFPYNFYHHQVYLALSKRTLSLGELSHTVSRQLPIFGDPGSVAFGNVNLPSSGAALSSSNAQLMLTDLSPEQIQVLTLPDWPAPETDAAVLEDRFREYYSSEYNEKNPLNSVNEFMRKTGVTAVELESLLATRSQTPVPSTHATAIAGTRHAAQYGAAYVNVANGGDVLALTGIGDSASVDKTTYKTFDRLQRFIRLQRWLKIPWADLDTLLISTPRIEAVTGKSKISTNTLRTVGVFKHLAKRYKVSPGEFAGIIDRVAIFSAGGKLSLFDETFNKANIFDRALILDNRALTLPLDTQTASTLANGLKLDASTGFFLSLVEECLETPPKMSQAFITKLYRQSRIARLFNLSLEDLYLLVNMLGGVTYTDILKNGTIRNAAPRTTPDLFDLLMQCDWAVTWFKDAQWSVKALDDLINYSTAPLADIVTSAWVDNLRIEATSLSDSVSEGLTQMDIPTLTVGAGIDNRWYELVFSTLLNDAGFIFTTEDVLVTVRQKLQGLTDAKIDGVPWEAYPGLSNTLNLISSTVTFYLRLQNEKVGGVLSDIGLSPQTANDLLLYIQSSPDALLAAATGEVESFKNMLEHLYKLCELKKATGISQLVFLKLAQHPQWLDPNLAAPLPVSLASIYLLTSYTQWAQYVNQPEKKMMEYLEFANIDSPNDAHPAQCAERLSSLLELSSADILQASNLLSGSVASCISEIHWLIRLKQTTVATGLSVTTLLLATSLTPDSPQAEWEKVGSASIGSTL
jgi:hypothetical protein